MQPGTKVRIHGLLNAAQHNGKVGSVTATKAPEGRLGVKLDDGKVLAIKPENLDRITKAEEEPSQRTLKRNNGLLREFDGSPDPNVLALYYHFADMAFDCFNAHEYHTQMMRYYDKDLSVKLVVPRMIGPNEHFLVALQHSQHDKNTLCEVAFNCSRSFVGISMLVKKRCFNCHKPGAPRCQCNCASFCLNSCKKSDIGREHEILCNRIRKSNVIVEEDCLQLLE